MQVRQLEITQMKYQQLQLENEHLNHEFGKNLLARNRLENLCRELQKHNREVKVIHQNAKLWCNYVILYFSACSYFLQLIEPFVYII